MTPEYLIIFGLLLALAGRENIRRGDAVITDFAGILFSVSAVVILIARIFE